jgi:HK97 family phage major capsid protein
MKLSQKEAAELRREKAGLEQKRLEIKKKCEQHRAELTTEQLSAETENMRSLSEQIDTINERLKEAPEPETRGGRFMQTPTGREINADNYRSSLEYRDAFFRSYMNRSIAEADREIMEFGKRAVTDMNGLSVTSGASYLVPETTANQIKSIITKYGAVYAAVTKYNFNGDVTIPIGTADAPTNNADGTDTLTFTFTEVTINQQAVVATVAVKNLLLKNSIAGLEAYIAMEIGKYIGLLLENYVIRGSLSTSKFLGIVTALTAYAKTYTDLDWEVINDVQGDVEAPYGDNGSWIMTRKTFFKKFRSITDANGQPIAKIASAGSGATSYTIDGRPVIFSTRMTENEFVYGDLSQDIVNESQELVIESDSSVKFGEDSTVWRGKVYAGGTVMFASNAFVYYKPAA